MVIYNTGFEIGESLEMYDYLEEIKRIEYAWLRDNEKKVPIRTIAKAINRSIETVYASSDPFRETKIFAVEWLPVITCLLQDYTLLDFLNAKSGCLPSVKVPNFKKNNIEEQRELKKLRKNCEAVVDAFEDVILDRNEEVYKKLLSESNRLIKLLLSLQYYSKRVSKGNEELF